MSETQRPVPVRMRPSVHKAMRYTGRNGKAIARWMGEHVREMQDALVVDDRIVHPGDWIYEVGDDSSPRPILLGIRTFGVLEGGSFDEFWERVDE